MLSEKSKNEKIKNIMKKLSISMNLLLITKSKNVAIKN